MSAKISVIIPTYNSEKIIAKCLGAIISCAQNLDYEILIVDNNSQDATKEIVRKIANTNGQVRLLERAENLGYGRALNFGSVNANGEFLVFMNPDVILKNNAFYLMLKKVEGGNYILAAPTLLNESGEKQISVWSNFPSPLNLLFEYSMLNGFLKKLGVKRFPLYIYNYEPKPEVAPKVLSGAIWLIRKQDFEMLAGFDENFFLFYEDTDFCRRLYIQNPNALVLVSAAEAEHLEGRSSVAPHKKILDYSFFSLFYYLRKYYQPWQIFVFKLLAWCVSLINFCLLSLINLFKRLRPNLMRRRKEYSYFLSNALKF
ncbi:MAG: glycosyltransferase family 2 protein [Candidatus Pacebacteria bacterium]|nr:glycosyltransferase family 2 protein [Candidatus Paceibacterota bacterium]